MLRFSYQNPEGNSICVLRCDLVILTAVKILLIEDETKTAHFLKQGLEEQGFRVDLAYDGEQGCTMVMQHRHDVVVTDIVMPGMDGKSLCRLIRQAGRQVPILMLTALSTTEDVVSGLESGADDYLTKPFAFKELVARIHTLARRNQKAPLSEIRVADLVLDPERRRVTRAGQEIVLTPKEMDLLVYFLQNKNKVLSRMQLAREVWNIAFDTGTNMVDVYVNYLRKKMDVDFQPRLIITHFGAGYELREPEGVAK